MMPKTPLSHRVRRSRHWQSS
eukprot:COSAG02_NODE_47234_length_342_cov_1.489712_1_plen_20_part_10